MGKAAAFRFLYPFFAVVVAVVQYALVVPHGVAYYPEGFTAEVLGLLEALGEFRQGLRHYGVYDGIGVGYALAAAQHSELELVAGEGEWGGAVAVGGVYAEPRHRAYAAFKYPVAALLVFLLVLY